MKKRKIGVSSLCIILCLLTVQFFIPDMKGSAQTGDVLTGDYVAIINTNPDINVSESTGNIVFDSSADGENAECAPTGELSDLGTIIPDITSNPSSVTKTYTIGDTINARNNNYTLVSAGEHIYVWMETGLKSTYDDINKTETAANELINVYENKAYKTLNTLANGNIPYLDGSGKLSVLLENDPTTTAAGYYAGEDFITAIHINCPKASSYMVGSFEGINGLLAHEGQHALYRLLAAGGHDNNAYRWLDEGLAITSMEWTWGAEPTSQWLSYIEGSSEIRNGSHLVYETYRKNTAEDYSMPALYVRYLANRYSKKYAPMNFMKKLYTVFLYKNNNADTPKNFEDYMNEVLKTMELKNDDGSDLTFRESLVDFYVASMKMDKSGKYSFYGDTTVYNTLKNYPVYMGKSGEGVSLSGTSAILVKTENKRFVVPSGAGSDIKFVAFDKTTDIFEPAGNGTEKNPYKISNAIEFTTALKAYPTANFELTENIDLSNLVQSSVDVFSGTLNGKGYTVSGINKAIFYSNNGIIKNINLVGTMNDVYLGSAATLACVNNGVIEDVVVSGEMTPTVNGASIRNIPIWGSLVAVNNANGRISRSASLSNIDIKIDANVSHDTICGNLVGKNSGRIEDSYSRGSITVSRVGNTTKSYYVGGIAGLAKDGLSKPLVRCYSTTEITNNSSGGSTDVSIGRLVGAFSGYVYTENDYALDGMSALGSGSGVTSKTDDELKTQSTFENWNFNGVWVLNDGDYPSFSKALDIKSVKATDSVDIFTGQTLDSTTLYGAYIVLNDNYNNPISITSDMIDYTTFNGDKAGTETISCSYRDIPFNLTVNVSNPTSVEDLAISASGKTSFVVGRNYDSTGVVLSAKLDGSSYATKIYSAFSNDKDEPLTKADTLVTFTYFGKTVSQNISVSEKAINKIEVVSEPNDSSYASGELLDFTNLGAKLYYNDDSYTPSLELNDLKAKGVKIAKRLSNGTWSELDESAPLTIDDNGAELYLFIGDVLPSDSNSVTQAEITTLLVEERMSLQDQTVVMKIGKPYDYAITEGILGSGYINVSKVSGTLPKGVTAELPYEAGEEGSNNFMFMSGENGITETAPKDFPLCYKVENETTGQIIYINITISVQYKSSVTGFDFIGFKADKNKGLIDSDVAGVVDTVSGDITLTVPYGTEKKLMLDYVVKDGATVETLDGDIFFMKNYDFAAENPIKCKVVAEDGTEKVFTITLVVADRDILFGITNGATYCNGVSFTALDDIASVTDNKTILNAVNNVYSITEVGEHTVVGTDNVGNTETVKITINKNHIEKIVSINEDGLVTLSCELCKEKREVRFSNYINKTENEENFEPSLDVNNDKIINSRDFAIINREYLLN